MCVLEPTRRRLHRRDAEKLAWDNREAADLLRGMNAADAQDAAVDD